MTSFRIEVILLNACVHVISFIFRWSWDWKRNHVRQWLLYITSKQSALERTFNLPPIFKSANTVGNKEEGLLTRVIQCLTRLYCSLVTQTHSSHASFRVRGMGLGNKTSYIGRFIATEHDMTTQRWVAIVNALLHHAEQFMSWY